MKYFITFCLLVWGVATQAQIEKTIHQTFELEEEVMKVSLDIFDEFKVEQWAGNTIMVVTKVELVSGAQHLLDFYVNQGRYNIEVSGEESALLLTSKDKVRKGMKYRDMIVYENIETKLFIPENFELSGDNQLLKKAEEGIVSDQ